MSSESRWTLVGGDPLLWRSWDPSEYVIYHAASGDTHLINPVTAEVLRQLERAERSPWEIAEAVAKRHDTEADDELVRQITSLLQHLDRIGLVEPVR